MSHAGALYEEGTLTRRKFKAYETKMRKKYNVGEYSLYRDIHLPSRIIPSSGFAPGKARLFVCLLFWVDSLQLLYK